MIYGFWSKNKKEILFGFLLVLVFFALRLPAIHRPYHQDEYKWVQYAHPEIIAPGTVPHPPLTEFIYTKIAPVFGDNGFRFVPLLFSLINLFLIFYLTKIIFDKKTAIWSSAFFALSFYSVLASTMVDVDGAVMPMFFLLLVISYFQLKKINFHISGYKNWFWLTLLLVGGIGGFFIKVSGILPIFAVFLDFLLEKGVFDNKRKILKYAGFGFLGVIILCLLLVLSKLIFPFFNLEYSLKYWEHFVVFKNRGWMQTFIQFFKSILYLSPFFVSPLVFIDREIFKKTRLFFIFIFTGLVFYLLIFDFSLGALDRYFEFLIIPLCIISASIFNKYTGGYEKNKWLYLFWSSVVMLAIYLVQFANQSVPALYPKTEWIGRISSLHWNFLYPFSGGSGPLGFYVSFAFIGLSWILGLGLIVWFLFDKNKRNIILVLFLLLGVTYNGVFIQEYLFGTNNGSAPKLVNDSVNFIKNNPEIKKVLVYNDNGGYNIKQLDKYERRVYAVPGFESTYEPLFKSFDGYVMYLDVPRVMKNSIYERYFNSCSLVYSEKDKYITAQVLKCNGNNYSK